MKIPKPFKIIMLFFGILFFYHESIAQCVNGTHTDPNTAYVKPNTNDFKKNTFDWRNATFPINKIDYINFAPANPSFPLNSPFYSTANYLQHIAGGTQSNFQPEDGWELIKQDFGYVYASGQWNGLPIANFQYDKPMAYFILYNKYQSKLRIMATIPVGSTYDKISVNLSFILPNTSYPNYNNFKVSALFNNYDTLARALDQKTKILNVSTIASFPATKQDFFYADFQMSFDPCECYFESGLSVKFNVISTSNITLGGKILGISQPISSITGSQGTMYGDDVNENYLTSVFSNSSNNVYGLNQTYKNLIALQNDIKNHNPSIGSAIDFLEHSLKVLTVGGIINPELKAAVETASTVLDFLSTVSGVGDKTVQPTVITGQLALSGTIVQNTVLNGCDFLLAVPGSKNANLRPEYASTSSNGTLPNYPEYNELLGLFALFRTPHINEYKNNPDLHYGEILYGGIAMVNSIGPWQYEYQLQPNQFEFSFNPIVNSTNTKIFAALEIEGMPANIPGYSGNAPTNISLKDSTNFRRYTTKFFPLECLENVITKETYSFSGTVQDFNNGVRQYKARRVNIIFTIYYEFKPDEYGLIHHSVQIIKYPLIVDNIPLPFSADPRFNQLKNYPSNLVLGNTTYATAQTISSFGKVTINGHLTNTSSGEVIIYAENGFTITPGAIIDPHISLKVGFIPDFCGGNPIQPITDLQTKCESVNYLANQYETAPVFIGDNISQSESNDYFTFFPNPANDILNLDIALSSNNAFQLSIIDMQGKILKTVKDKGNEGWNHSQMNIQDLLPGIYFIQFNSASFHCVKKLIILR